MRQLRVTVLSKMVSISLVLLAVIAAIGYIGYTKIQELEGNLENVHRRMELAKSSVAISALLYQESGAVRGYILYETDSHITEFRDASETLTYTLDQLSTTTTQSSTKQQIEDLKKFQADYTRRCQEAISLFQQGKKVEALALLAGDELALIQKAQEFAHRMSIENTANAQAEFMFAQTSGDQARIELGGIALAGVVLGLVLAIFLARRLTQPIKRLAEAARRLSVGDLTLSELPVTTSDEIADVTKAFNGMIKTLRDLIGSVTQSSHRVSESVAQLTTTADAVAGAAQGVSQAMVQVAGSATGQVTAIHSASDVVRELQSAIQQIAQGSQEQARAAEDSTNRLHEMMSALGEAGSATAVIMAVSTRTTDAAGNGKRVVADTMAGMERIRQSVDESVTNVQAMSELSARIGAITGEITAIAKQTNLLALNAAIEAARAGEHGRGFSVVAEEVRKLAERAAQSTREIGELVQGIQSGTDLMMGTMQRTSVEVGAGVKLAGEAGKALQLILDAAVETREAAENNQSIATKLNQVSVKVSESVDSIASVTEENSGATEQMAAGADSVLHSVGQMVTISSDNAGAAEEVSASAEEMTTSTEQIAAAAGNLADIAHNLQEQIARFKIA